MSSILKLIYPRKKLLVGKKQQQNNVLERKQIACLLSVQQEYIVITRGVVLNDMLLIRGSALQKENTDGLAKGGWLHTRILLEKPNLFIKYIFIIMWGERKYLNLLMLPLWLSQASNSQCETNSQCERTHFYTKATGCNKQLKSQIPEAITIIIISENIDENSEK